MKFDVFLLFFVVMLTVLFVSGIVLWILRRDYLPVIRRLERERESRERPRAGNERDTASGKGN